MYYNAGRKWGPHRESSDVSAANKEADATGGRTCVGNFFQKKHTNIREKKNAEEEDDNGDDDENYEVGGEVEIRGKK